jgi:ribosome-binding protein aMBF1 (putative translation factor)
MTTNKTPRTKAKLVPAAKVHKKWRGEPGFKSAYDALDEEFAILAALIDARSRAGLSQEEIARRMNTSQPAVARLESGGHRASLKSLKSYAAATGHRLLIKLEPVE